MFGIIASIGLSVCGTDQRWDEVLNAIIAAIFVQHSNLATQFFISAKQQNKWKNMQLAWLIYFA